MAHALLFLKLHYKLYTEVLVQIGQFLWENWKMAEQFPDVMIINGEFYDPETEETEMGFQQIYSAEREAIFHPDPVKQDQIVALHFIAVAIEQAEA